MHRDDFAGRGQDAVGDLFQELLLIEYEIVYDNYYPGSVERQPFVFREFSGLLVTQVISAYSFERAQISIIEHLVRISNTEDGDPPPTMK